MATDPSDRDPRQDDGAVSGRWSVDRRVGRRGLWVAALLFVLFAAWTVAVRVGITEGSRESSWIISSYGTWPETVDHLNGTSDIQFSIFATYDTGRAAGGSGEPVTPTVGRPTVGTTVDSFDSHNINGSRFVTGRRAGRVTALSVYVAAPIDRAPNDRFEVAIYSDAHGAPHDRLAVSGPGTLIADAWNEVAIDADLRPGTAYWFLYNTNGTSGALNNAVYSPVPATPVDALVRSIRSPDRIRLADRISFLGAQLPTTVVLLGLAALVARRRPASAVVYIFGFALSLAVAFAVRTVFFEPFGRYPSGHVLRAAYVIVIASAFARRRSVDILGGLLIAAIVIASIYNYGHYFEESLGGLLLAGGAAATALSFAAMPARRGRRHVAGRAGGGDSG